MNMYFIGMKNYTRIQKYFKYFLYLIWVLKMLAIDQSHSLQRRKEIYKKHKSILINSEEFGSPVHVHVTQYNYIE